ncbi:hypothetical protein [Aliikangiella maris]|uniref:Uncharacterized protein n=2 Tax=Aliikangiella maris TaxID=3162458 RepID=A0ABV2BSA7_9GAMM
MKILNSSECQLISGGSINSKDITDLSIDQERLDYAEKVCDSGLVESYSATMTETTSILGWEFKSGDTLKVDCNTKKVSKESKKESKPQEGK